MYYYNSGFGRDFFQDLYNDVEIRKEPATKDEFLQAGLSEADFIEYIRFVKRLYGEYFIDRYFVDTKYFSCNQPEDDNDKLWTEFNDFCIDHNLVLEFIGKNGRRMPVHLPIDVMLFQFVYHSPECPNAVHICSLDEFRIVIERCLARLSDDWYLDARYNTDVVYEDDKDAHFLMGYNSVLKKRVPLTQHEAQNLLISIQGDITSLKLRMKNHSENVPPILREETHWKERSNIIQLQERWLGEHVELERELCLLEECEEIVREIVESGVHSNVHPITPDETLYIHKGRIICEKENHPIEQATAVLVDGNGHPVELNVNHCIKCQKFFLHYDIYKRYREKYGIILGNIRMVKNEDFSPNTLELSDESALHLCGYNVSQKDNLSDDERRTIIASVIESGSMTKKEVVKLLHYFVEVNGAKKGNEQARQKWISDLDFALAYNTPRQNHYNISEIARYCRNRFVIRHT